MRAKLGADAAERSARAARAKRGRDLLPRLESFEKDLLDELKRQDEALRLMIVGYRRKTADARFWTYLTFFLAVGFFLLGLVAMPLALMHYRPLSWLPIGSIILGLCIMLGARAMTWRPSLQALQQALDSLERQHERLSAFGSTLSLDLSLNFELICREDPDRALELLNLKRRFLEGSSERTRSLLIPGVELP